MGKAESHTTWDNGDLVQGISVGQHLANDGMACFMVGCYAPVFFTDNSVLTFKAHDNLVHGTLKIFQTDKIFPFPGSHKGGFVDQVGNIRSAETGDCSCYCRQIDILFGFNFTDMHFQNLGSPLHIRGVNCNLAIKTTRTQQGGIKNIRTVCGRNNNYGLIGAETIHLHQQGIEGLFPFVSAATCCPTAAFAANCINLINKNNAGSIFFSFCKQFTNP